VANRKAAAWRTLPASAGSSMSRLKMKAKKWLAKLAKS